MNLTSASGSVGAISVGGTGWGDSTITYNFITPSGTEAAVTIPTKKELNPRLYMKYVKSKLTKSQQAKVKERMGKLQKLIPYAKDMGQTALYEELSKELMVMLRESEAVACGCEQFLFRENIDKFMGMVKDRVVKFDKFENFPRVVPQKIRTKVKSVQKVFDQLHILFIDYSGEKPIKSNSEKIREKDPILFGTFNFAPDKFYYIADWVDEYCDLTMSGFLEKMKTDHPEFSLSDIPEITEENFNKIKEEVIGRDKRLKDTERSNWVEKIREEERARLEAEKKAEAERKEQEAKSKASRWKFWQRKENGKEQGVST